MTIEIANKIRNGRAVGTDYVVTNRDRGNSGIVARFATRDEAAAYVAASDDCVTYPVARPDGRIVYCTVPE